MKSKLLTLTLIAVLCACQPEPTEEIIKAPTPSVAEAVEPVEPTPVDLTADSTYLAPLIRIKTDAFNGRRNLSHTTIESTNVRNGLQMSVTESASILTPWLTFNYFADSWLFVKSYGINVDGEIYTFDPPRDEIYRDNDRRGVWEWYDRIVSPTDLELIEAIAQSEKTLIRFTGKTYHQDYTVTPKDKKALADMLKLYHYIKAGGQLAN